jgi:hypothetical protein
MAGSRGPAPVARIQTIGLAKPSGRARHSDTMEATPSMLTRAPSRKGGYSPRLSTTLVLQDAFRNGDVSRCRLLFLYRRLW